MISYDRKHAFWRRALYWSRLRSLFLYMADRAPLRDKDNLRKLNRNVEYLTSVMLQISWWWWWWWWWLHEWLLRLQFHKHLLPTRHFTNIISLLYNFYKSGIIVPIPHMKRGWGLIWGYMVSIRAIFVPLCSAPNCQVLRKISLAGDIDLQKSIHQNLKVIFMWDLVMGLHMPPPSLGGRSAGALPPAADRTMKSMLRAVAISAARHWLSNRTLRRYVSSMFLITSPP